MADVRALIRLVDELLWSLRREGFRIATSQAIDAARALRAIGVADRQSLRDALACVVVDRAGDRARFDRTFDAFFAAERTASGTLWKRLAAQGFDDSELAELRTLLAAFGGASGDGVERLGVLLERGPALDRLLRMAGVARTLDLAESPLQAGFYAHRVLDAIGTQRAYQSLAALRTRLVDALGHRGEALADALKDELQRAGDEVREHVKQRIERRTMDAKEGSRTLDRSTFATLSDDEVADVTRAVRRFVERLRGGERVRKRRAQKGRIDLHRTLRAAMRTGGVPFSPMRRARRRDKPRLVLLCDVSDSVRTAARFMLEFVHASHELFDRTRSFVFVSELGETTELFARESPTVALGNAYGGSIVSVHDNSNYGRVLREFAARHLREIDRRTTVAILGDGRTNYHDDAAEVLDRVRERAGALLWFCPESRALWATGDSAMLRYAPKCSAVLEVRTARELEQAARTLLVHR